MTYVSEPGSRDDQRASRVEERRSYILYAPARTSGVGAYGFGSRPPRVESASHMPYVPEPGPHVEQRAPRVEDRSRPAPPATPAHNASEDAFGFASCSPW
jgi:hypothetical protein